MIQITPQMRILLSVKAVDFRKGIDGLAGICRQILEADPFSGCVFVFQNSRGTAIVSAGRRMPGRRIYR